MKLGRVIGNAVSSVKNPAYERAKLMVVEPVTPTLKPCGNTHLAVDLVGAGPGDVVLVAEEGRGAREQLNNPRSPIRTTLIGIVDRVNLRADAQPAQPVGEAAGHPTGGHGRRFWSR